MDCSRVAILVSFFGLTLMPFSGYSQVPDSIYQRLESRFEWILEGGMEDESEDIADEYIQFLLEAASHPVNVNTASLEQLYMVPGMRPVIARGIVEYRENRPFEDIDELIHIRGVGPVTVEQFRPFVTVGKVDSPRRGLFREPGYWTRNSRFEVISRYQQVLEEQAGYKKSVDTTTTFYSGSPIRYYQRVNYRSNHLSMNLTQVKAPGETLAHPLYFDYNSGHIAIQNHGRMKMLVLGDYGLYFGQGLVMRTGLSFGKGTEVIRTRENDRGVRPYQSSGQTQAQRGMAVTYGNKLQGTLFYSNRNLSATSVSEDTIRFPTATGLHRTQNELDRRFNTNMQTYGGRIRYASDRVSIGVSGYQALFDKYILPYGSVYNQYDFEGNRAGAAGFDYLLFVGHTVFSGEIAQSINGGRGLISGVTHTVGVTEMNLTYRNYSKDFQSLFGSGFGELSKPQNEEGLYVAIRHPVSRAVELRGYFDQFRFKAPRYGTRQATQGYDWLALATFRVSGDIQLYLMLREKKREDDMLSMNNMGRDVYVTDHNRRGSVRMQMDYQVSRSLRSRTRMEQIRSKPTGEQMEYGILIFQDFRWIIMRNLLLDGRITIFDTESYASRIYQFENDMLYVMRNPALFDRGQRSYLLFRYQLSDTLAFWLKYDVTVYENRLTVGSGLDESIGNRRSNIGIQMRMMF